SSSTSPSTRPASPRRRRPVGTRPDRYLGEMAEDKGAPVEIEVAGRTLAITSPGKVMLPERGETKLDLANYYLAVGDALMGTVRIALDPGPDVTFEMVREAAAEVRTFFAEIGITAYPKTTGNRGLHLYVRVEPGWDSYGVRQAAVATARFMEERRPDLVTGAW